MTSTKQNNKKVQSQGKRLIIDTMVIKDIPEEFRAITYLACSKKAETLYLVHQNSDGDDECYELGTDAEKLTEIRDYLIDVVSKIENRYGLEQSVKILKSE